MIKGDIVLIPFPFTNLTGTKNRPALLLATNKLDITVSFISSQLKWKEHTDILVQPSLENGLKKESVIRLSKLATIDKDLALGLLGKLSNENMEKVDQNLKVILSLS